jgi:hypothetical protein
MRNRGQLGGLFLIALVSVACSDDVDTDPAGGGGAAGEGGGGQGGVGGDGGQAAKAAKVEIIRSPTTAPASTSPSSSLSRRAHRRHLERAFNADPTNFYHVEYRVSTIRCLVGTGDLDPARRQQHRVEHDVGCCCRRHHLLRVRDRIREPAGVRSAQRVWLASLPPSEAEFGTPLEVTDPAEAVASTTSRRSRSRRRAIC